MPSRLQMPLSPMEAHTVVEIPVGPNWQYEPKWDGFRCLAFRRDKKIELPCRINVGDEMVEADLAHCPRDPMREVRLENLEIVLARLHDVQRMDAERLTRRLAAALQKLSDADRDTLLLYAWGHLDYAAIATATDVPIGTVRSRLNRARRVLRRAAGTDTPEQETDHGRTDVAPQHA